MTGNWVLCLFMGSFLKTNTRESLAHCTGHPEIEHCTGTPGSNVGRKGLGPNRIEIDRTLRTYRTKKRRRCPINYTDLKVFKMPTNHTALKSVKTCQFPLFSQAGWQRRDSLFSWKHGWWPLWAILLNQRRDSLTSWKHGWWPLWATLLEHPLD